MVRRALGAVAVAGAATLAWALVEAHAFTLRRVTVPVLPRGADPIRILHLSDLHLTPGQRDKIAWVRSLASEPVDLVVTTGDNLAHPLAVPPLLGAYEPLMSRPGLFVFGSNDYFGPRPKNPLAYFGGPSLLHREAVELPSEDLRARLTAGGWKDVNNARTSLEVNGTRIRVVGLDDPHIGRDKLPSGRRPRADLTLGIVHAPYRRALEALADDGAQLILAGHTHGGQVCIPGVGALVTNCDLDTARVKGLSTWPDADGAWLHVSAGLGTSPYAPIRFACRPEATVLTLVERGDD
ncbi:metallophosphoesterase [Demequina sp.]|uniref:metallophosphoesterase n=1 Tax=Demequina sp. TaxID=2050685 RepID=UPI003D0D1B3C